MDFEEWYKNDDGYNVMDVDVSDAKRLCMNSSVKNKKRLHFLVAIWHGDFDPSSSNNKNKNNA
eukprot:4892010-Ditylum_brightwellii.AAC.1